MAPVGGVQGRCLNAAMDEGGASSTVMQHASKDSAPSASQQPDMRAAMLDALPDAVGVIDAVGNLLAANTAWVRLMGPEADRSQMAGDTARPFRHCLPPSAALQATAELGEKIRAVVDGRIPSHQTGMHIETADGRRWYRVAVRAFAFSNAAAIITYQAMPAKGKADLAPKDRRDHLYQAQKMEALGTLVAGVAHEINNPISLIMFNLPIVRRVWQDVFPLIDLSDDRMARRKFGGFTLAYLHDHFVQLMDDMDMAANRVSKIVKDLKHFSRRSRVSEKEPFAVNEAVSNAVRLAQTTLQKSGVALALDLDDNLPPVYGNLPSIEQIALNILINAIQAIDHPKGQVGIKTGRKSDDDSIFIAVSDNGRGVPADMAAKMFDPFVTDKQDRGGSGLGLAVSDSLAQAHEGRITYAPAGEQGSVFTVWLPSVHQQDLVEVLVVDDDAAVRQLIVQLLSRSGRYRVKEAATGIDGLLRIGTTTPDLLILDLEMPGMKGLDVCRAVQQNEQLADMKVLITTGHPNHPDLEEIRAMGYTDCYIKPVRVESFRSVVNAMMASSSEPE